MQSSEAALSLLKQLSISEDFPDGSRKIAHFFKATEEHISPGELISTLLGTQTPLKMQEYFLFSILDIGVSDFDLMKALLPFQHLKRLLGRYSYFKNTISDQEQELLARFQDTLPVNDIKSLDIASKAVSLWIDKFINHEEPGVRQRTQLSTLYKFEAEALRARSNWLSEHADTYNMKAMMRLLPLISVCDESAKMIIDLAELIEKGTMPGAPILSFEMAMKTDAFEKWLKVLSKQPECALFVRVMKEQQVKKIPTRLLVAVSTLTRAIQGNGKPPLSWISQAIDSSTNEQFLIDAGPNHSSLTSILNQSGVTVEGTSLSGNFLKSSFATLIGDDNLTRTAESTLELTIHEIVAKCMKKDTLLMRLLDNPKVYNTPGLIQRIAVASHSLTILQKIARTRELHTGQANAGVALALLRNPTNVPIMVLRQFINPRFVSIMEMKELIRSPYGVRRDIYEEVKSFVERRR